jgi:streptogramin lyase
VDSIHKTQHRETTAIVRRVAILVALAAMVAAWWSGDARAITVAEFPSGAAKLSLGALGPITGGPDGNVWFVEGGHTITRITPAGVMTAFPVSAQPTRVTDLTAGPDGNVWFTAAPNAGGGTVGRITASGTITSFPVLAPLSITTGPDGNLWFLTADDSYIGRMTLTGGVTTFPAMHEVIAGIGEAWGLAAGPGGRVWFTGVNGGIGAITTAGALTAPPFPTAPHPADLTAGPDGNLWFRTDGGTIDRMTPTGVVTKFPAPEIASIATGTDGNLWFTADHEIGRITPAGAITVFPVGLIAQPGSITTSGPDVWFTDTRAGKIGRVSNLTAGRSLAQGQSVWVSSVRGVVKILRRGSAASVTLKTPETIRVGSTIDARHGTVGLIAEVDRAATTRTATFSSGEFMFSQTASAPLADLIMLGGDFSRCRTARHARATTSGMSTKVIRTLRGNGEGGVRAIGQYAAATVRGVAQWTITDRCDGTLVQVARGAVAVLDKVKHSTVSVTARHSYLARSRR